MTTTKSTLKRILCVISCCLVVVFSFAVPASASNSDYTFEFNIPEPLSNEYSGYIITPFVRKDNLNTTLCNIYFWTITPVNSTDLTTIPSVSYTYNSTSNTATLLCGTGSNSGSWYFSLWTTTSGSSNIRHVVSDLIDYDTSVSFTIRPSSTPSNYWTLTPKFKGLTSADVLPTGRTETYDVLFSADSTLYNELLKIENHFVMMLSKMDLSNEQLAEAVSKLNEIYDTCISISGTLADFVYFYWEEFTYYQLPEQFNAVCSRLDTIIRLLNKKGETEQTTVDSSKVDEYLDIEQSLVNNDEAESALNEFDISIDGQAYSFIWDFITDCFNSHAEVFGLVITILTLGIIALILNR